MSTPVRRYVRDPKQGLLRAIDDFQEAVEAYDSPGTKNTWDLAWRRLLMAIAYYRHKQLRRRPSSEFPPAKTG
jgi:hypothetical protein